MLIFFLRVWVWQLITWGSPSQADDRAHMLIVGSSTVYPFSKAVAQEFKRLTQFDMPKIASTGTGGGIKLFCKGLGKDTADFANASRRIKSSELEMCQNNGVTEIIEVLIGYDGIVFANAVGSQKFNVTRRDVFLALAEKIPTDEGLLINNPHRYWSDIRQDLPHIEIEVLGPPPSSGTRDAFEILLMQGGCNEFDWIKAINTHDKQRYQSICHSVREDGPYVNVGENDNLVIQKLQRNRQAFGIFGFSFLDQNAQVVQAAMIDDVFPDFATIADGRYPASRPLYFYAKKDHINEVPGMRAYLRTFIDEKAMGSKGYLVDKGLVPLNKVRFNEIQTIVKTMQVMKW